MNRFAAWRGFALTILGALALWEALYFLVGEIALRSPAQTVRLTLALIERPNFWPHAAESLTAFAAAICIAVVLGLAIGLTLGFRKLAGEVFEPVLVAVYSLPKVTLYPILLLAFGLGISAKIAFGALHGFIPIALFTMNAVRNVKPILLKTGRVLDFGPRETATRILIPAALPEIFTGIRIGFSLTLIGTVLGEMFASQRGLGYMLMSAIGLHNVELIMSLTFLLTLFAFLVSGGLLAIDRHLRARW